jgi:hypothetical protein
MRRTVLLVVPLLALASLAASAEAGCPRLLTDPAGDVRQDPAGNPFPEPLDAADRVDLLWVDLSSTRTTLTATLRLADLNPEVQTLLDHAYSVSFAANGERYDLFAAFDKTHEWGAVWHQIAGTAESAEDPDGAGASAAEGIGEAQVRLDSRRDTVTITAQRKDFHTTGGLGRELRAVRAMTWAGVGDPVGGTFSSGDWGTTKRTYGLDRRC